MYVSNSLLQKIIRRLFPIGMPRMIGIIRDNNKNRIPKTRISSSTFIDHPQSLELGANVYIGHHNFIEASHGLKISDGVQITSFIILTTHSSHHSIRLYGNAYAGKDIIGYIKGPIDIGAYSFIGPHSTIMPNTKIGKGCLVAAYSYVKGDFPDFSIIAGNPAKVIGDTRTIDESFLKENPSLKSNYDAWAK